MKTDFDLDVLHAVCIEQPNAHSKPLRIRVTKLRDENTSIACLYNALSRLEDSGLVWSENRHSDGVEKPYFYPTKEGIGKDKEYLSPDGPSGANESVPEYNHSGL